MLVLWVVPYTAQRVYDEVCRTLLEDGGFQYVYTQASFLRDLAAAASEFAQQAACVKKFVIVPIQAGVAVYDLPTLGMDTQAAYVDYHELDDNSGFYMDEDNPVWQEEAGFPEQWRQDQVESNQIEIAPDPNFNGRQVTVEPLQGFYGTLEATSGVVDFDLAAAESIYGTISGMTGDYYVELDGPMFGTISDIKAGDTNLMCLMTAQPLDQTLVLASPIEIVPDSFAPYLKYRVLEKIFSTDGESKDMQRAAYCRARWQEGINIAKAVMGEILESPPGAQR